jgi:phosphohistidine phosphatase
MELFLIRHGIAADAQPGQGDGARPLTAEGRLQLKGVAQDLHSRGVRFDRLISSPLRRAMETAEQLAPLCSRGPEVSGALARPPDGELWSLLRGERVALVGHDPYLPMALGVALFGQLPPRFPWTFERASVAWLHGEPSPGRLSLWALLPPQDATAPW